MKNLFDGAAGVRSLIYIFLFMAGGFGTFYSIKGGVTQAQTIAQAALAQSKTNAKNIEEFRQKQILGLYKIEKNDEMNASQNKIMRRQTIILERIANKLNVETHVDQ